jgi:hypothetical protein
VLTTIVILRKNRFDTWSIVLIAIALCLYYFHFFHTSWDEFTIDAATHTEYVKFIAIKNAFPTPVDTYAARHPPLYYLFAAGIYKIAAFLGEKEPLLIVRHLSMACYIAFIIFSALLLRLLLQTPSHAYYFALSLLLSWPLGVTMGSRITCDIFLHAAEIATVYFLVRWLQEKNIRALDGVFISAGMSMLAKNPGVIMLGISFLILSLAIIEYRREIKKLLRWDLIISILFSLACGVHTFKHGWITNFTSHESPIANPIAWWNAFNSFNLFLFLYDTDMGLSHDMFWNMLPHTLLVGEYLPWKQPGILIGFHVLFLALMIYLVEGFWQYKKMLTKQNAGYFLLGLFSFIMIGAMMFMRIRTGNIEYGDARYIYPVVTVIAIYFGKVTEINVNAGRSVAYRFSMLLTGGFVLLTILLFSTQHIKFLIKYLEVIGN